MLTLDQFEQPSKTYPDWMVFENHFIQCYIDINGSGRYFARIHILPRSNTDSPLGFGNNPTECLEWINQTLPSVYATIRKGLRKAVNSARRELAEFERTI